MALIIRATRRNPREQRGLWRCLVLAQLAWLSPHTSAIAGEASAEFAGKWLRFETTRCVKAKFSAGHTYDQGCDKDVRVVARTKRGYQFYYDYLGPTECILDQAQPDIRAVRSEGLLDIFRVECSAISTRTSVRFSHLQKSSGANTVFGKREIALDFEFDQKDQCKLMNLSESSHEVRSDAVATKGPRKGEVILRGYTVDEIISFKREAPCRVYDNEAAAFAK